MARLPALSAVAASADILRRRGPRRSGLTMVRVTKGWQLDQMIGGKKSVDQVRLVRIHFLDNLSG